MAGFASWQGYVDSGVTSLARQRAAGCRMGQHDKNASQAMLPASVKVTVGAVKDAISG